jgi:hypothetical protein
MNTHAVALVQEYSKEKRYLSYSLYYEITLGHLHLHTELILKASKILTIGE